MMTRRAFAALGGAAALAACARPEADVSRSETFVAPPPPPPMPDCYGAVAGEPYPVPAVPAGIVPPDLWRREVANPLPGAARGTILVDPGEAVLHFVEGPDRAIRYGVSPGRDGFAWSGTARLQFGREWPRWNVPDTMIARQPELEPYSVANGGMDPGPGNPLGARALYLFRNGEDTLYRIHGGCEPRYLGQAVSSGCIRMLDQDVIDLYDRSVHGADVIVLPSMLPESLAAVY
ncbi:L,D-transpeptidase family protein [Rhodobacterales bacterium HKCCE2091]|nr:L,D-transpeptidase family protein [Rhodobacterales bacterium HKCCE2091]